MSIIQKLKEDFHAPQKPEAFHQIPQTRPLRRNQSQQFINNKIYEDMNFRNPNNYNNQNNPEKLLSTNIKLLNPEQNKLSSNNKSRLNIEKNGFNPMNHIPPKYDLYGYLKPLEKRKEDMSLLENKRNIKIPWQTTNTNKSGALTRSELMELRRKERIPDPSYDLDQDGYVGNVDLVISKRFDVDNDGKLNEKEKKAAYEGIIY